jgi:hypothetical protein
LKEIETSPEPPPETGVISAIEEKKDFMADRLSKTGKIPMME